MSTELSLERLQHLYTLFRAHKPYAGWAASYRKDAEWVRELTEAEFGDPANQERLWRLKGIATLGPGESVNVKGAYTDPEVIDALFQLRGTPLPDAPEARAKALQDHYAHILAMVHPRHATMRPQAKLARMLTAFFARDTAPLYSTESSRRARSLVLGTGTVGPIEGMVLVRHRLRAALGAEADLDEDVRRAMFCWWLHEHFAGISQGEDPPSPTSDIPETIADAPKPSLVLLPVAQQRKGLAAIGGYLETWRAVVSAARNGATPDDIVTTMRTTYGITSLSPKSCRGVFNDVRNAGFLEAKDGLWHPSDAGRTLVEEDPPDILVERFLLQTFGIPQVIRYLRDGPRTRNEVILELRRRYPSWTSNFAPRAQLSWARALGLVAGEADGRVSLSDYGATWESRLPEEMHDPAVSAKVSDEDHDEDVDDDLPLAITAGKPATNPLTDQPFPALLAALRKNLPDFVLDEPQLRSLHVAWHCNPGKRFVLLSGLSGTGKTALLHHYARAYAELCGLDPNEQLAIVAVSPEWRDPTGLLGYHNPLHSEPTWQKEPALRLLLDAARHPGRPYFLVLDEMNLAHVEHYFAPFLSAMETGRQLHLHEEEDDVNGVPPAINWPKNLFIGGTLNMDETTHPISDKVLDRAFTLEFWDVDLRDYLARRTVAPDLVQLLLDLHGILATVRRHFGYRTAGELLAFMGHADASTELLDQAVFSKVLPRLRGEDTPAFGAALAAAQKRCAEAKLTRCAGKLTEMQARLTQTGVARFWA